MSNVTCPNCGKSLSFEGDAKPRFCSSCGRELVWKANDQFSKPEVISTSPKPATKPSIPIGPIIWLVAYLAIYVAFHCNLSKYSLTSAQSGLLLLIYILQIVGIFAMSGKRFSVLCWAVSFAVPAVDFAFASQYGVTYKASGPLGVLIGELILGLFVWIGAIRKRNK